ncbi:hypothetical protein GX645_00810 [Candidatus Sumerlaeota bacterium]|nr:hypothetical protein [Candidatus Sumerlaeales bacterium]NLD60979.1 hypothetical protein [Candidatus Sumerlaeota bacterium]
MRFGLLLMLFCAGSMLMVGCSDLMERINPPSGQAAPMVSTQAPSAQQATANVPQKIMIPEEN